MATRTYIANFIRDSRLRLNLSQQELAKKAGVGLRFIRDLEQGKETLRLDKVNQVLALFGYGVVPGKELDPYQILADDLNKNVAIYLRNKSVLEGFIIGGVREGLQITGWKFVSNKNAKDYQATKDPSFVQIIEHRQIERIENINL
jgi:y4mF family transcriptional regulator